ncbi:MAG TPA: chemotaxis protein CheA [Nitrospirae bacterium]|nr:chemotaxis protein CheA [Nitrospirota bacterium]
MNSSKNEFIAEAEDIIESANEALLELQNAFNPDTLNSLFRAIHTMKGLSGLFGLQGITDLSHALESVLDDLRLGKIDFSDDAINFIFCNMDILKNLVVQVSEGKEVDDVSDSVGHIESFRKAASAKGEDLSIEDIGISRSVLKVLSEYEEHRLKSNIKDGKGLYYAKAVFSLTDFADGLEALNAVLKGIGEIIATLPCSDGIPEGSIGFDLLTSSDLNIEEMRSKVENAAVEEISPPRNAKPVSAADYVPKPADVTMKSSTNTVRVDIEKLDNILNTVGELVLAKGAVIRIGQELAETVGYTPLTLDVHKIAQTLDKKLSELQGHILELRMVPFSQIYTRLAQVVRRYTKEVKKEIDLELFGENTEIDKLLAEEIIDPLIHIIRNSIDHGIESNDKRKALGKKERGTITLKAFPKGNNVIITVQDDGAGLDADKILKTAIERKLIPEDQELEHKEILDLIFLPGLSTKEEVSEVSGRGMGMDIAKEKLKLFGGFIETESELGVGTSFTLTLPITLAIVKALIVQVADSAFCIPLTSISETFTVDPRKIQTIEEREVIEIRGEMLPLLRVARVFRLEEKPCEEYFAVVVGFGNKRLGLLVDKLTEQTEIILKPLGEHLKGIPGLAGAAELGRHDIILVLDVEAMMEESFCGKKKYGADKI